MGQRFQVKKLNKNDHKGVKDTARAVKKSIGIFGTFAIVAPIIKKHGKCIVGIAKNIVLKK